MRVTLVAVFILFSTSLQAQTIRGVVLDSIHGTPVDGGFVVLLDLQENEIARTLTDRAGRFVLIASIGGTYKLTSRRIGYRTWTSPELLLEEGEVLEYTMRIAGLPVRLAAVEATEEAVCNVDPAAGAETAVVWDEAQKALRAASWTANREGYYYSMILYERDSDRRGSRIGTERQSRQSGLYGTPFRSLPADQLASAGYIHPNADGTHTYYAPDANVLLSNRFLETHCFSIVRDTREHAGQVGLAFTPVEAGDVSDVEGTLWLDESVAELRSLEYHYTGLPRQLRDERIGGSLEFLPLPSGAWIVRHWNIRMPIVSLFSIVGRGRDSVLTGFRETGGEVSRFTDTDGTVLFEAEYATLVGVVFDSTRGLPLQGATITVAGTGDSSVSRWDGSFHLTGQFDGEYAVRFKHPRADSLGFVSRDTVVSLARSRVTQLDFAVPSLPTIRASLCPEEANSQFGWTVIGVLRDEETALPVEGAELIVTWPALETAGRFTQATDIAATVQTDSTGFFTLCNVQSNRSLTLFASTGERSSSFFTLNLGDDGVSTGGRVLAGGADRIWRQDIKLHPLGTDVSGVTGIVLDSERESAIGGAEIEILGVGRTTTSNDTGFFEFSGLPEGAHLLAVRGVGYHRLVYPVELTSGQTFALPPGTLGLTPLDVELLDPLVVAGERLESRQVRLRPFYARREEGVGSFVTRAEFEQWHPRVATDILRRVRGIRIRPNMYYGVGRDSRRFIVESARQVVSLSVRECPPLFFLDGVFIGNAYDTYIDNVMAVGNLEAIEAYSGPSQMPSIFNRTGSACGVIAFWTR